MLIEAICKYKIKEKNTISSIGSMKFIRVDDPILENTRIVCSDNQIPLFSDQFLTFTTTMSESRVFQLNFTGDSKEPAQIQAFESTYPCTHVYFQSSNLVFEFEIEKKLEQVISALRKLHSNLEIKRNTLRLSDKTETQSLNGIIVPRYVIKALDGEIDADISVLKHENLSSIYFNANEDLGTIKNRQLRRTELTNRGDDIAVGMESVAIDSSGSYTTVFEHTNNPGCPVLIKSFIKKDSFSIYNSITHCLIDSLYLIFFKVQDTVTVIVSKKLYNFVKLYNKIAREDQDCCNGLLKIPDLNSGMIHGDVWIVDKNSRALNTGYKPQKFDCKQVLKLIFNYSAVSLIHNAHSFWFFNEFKRMIYPMKFPGLMISPVTESTAYLIDGPYSFLVSSSMAMESQGRVVFSIETPEITSNMPKKDGLSSLLSDKLAANLKKAKNSLKSTRKQATKNLIAKIMEGKSLYIQELLKIKLEANNILADFGSSSVITKYFLNEPRHFPVHYIFDLETEAVQFQRGNCINQRDAVSLWLSIYQGTVDLELLANKKWIDLEFLCRRACVDQNASILQQILNKIKAVLKEGKNYRIKDSGKRGIQAVARRQVTGAHRKSRQQSVYTILQSMSNYNKLYSVDINTEETVEVICDPKRFVTQIRFRNKLYRLMRIEDILSCIECNFICDQLKASIIAYFQHFDLPFENRNEQPKMSPNSNQMPTFRIFLD